MASMAPVEEDSHTTGVQYHFPAFPSATHEDLGDDAYASPEPIPAHDDAVKVNSPSTEKVTENDVKHGATSWVRRTFLSEPIRLVTDVAKAGIKKTEEAVKTMTGEEDFHLGSTIRCAASWVTGDTRPYPKIHDDDDGVDARRPKINLVKEITISTLAYPGTNGEAVLGDISLTSSHFVFTPRSKTSVIRAQLFPDSVKDTTSANSSDHSDGPSLPEAESAAEIEDAEHVNSTSNVNSLRCNATPDEPSNSTVTEPLVFAYSLIRDVEMPMHIQPTTEVHMKVTLKSFQLISLLVPGIWALRLFQSLVAAAFVLKIEHLPAFIGVKQLSTTEPASTNTLLDISNDTSVATNPYATADSLPTSTGHENDQLSSASPSPESPESAWNFVDVRPEFDRMGLEGKWRLFEGNLEYEICPTYPAHLYVPVGVDDDVIKSSAAFRSKGRFPALTYYHRGSGAALLRCAQPLSGLSSKRNSLDEALVVAALDTGDSNKYHILDARPHLNALANKAGGKGYEDFSNYGLRCQGCFLDIENIHAMRNSIEAVMSACQMTNSILAWSADPLSAAAAPFVEAINRSQWLHHVRLVLEGATKIAEIMDGRKESVLVHCSDGWDRTAQLSTIAQIILDPYSRTVNGLMALLHKDWLSFGHKFEDRLGTLHKSRREVSPVFTQCLDAIWQLMQQHPQAFEFRSSFLVALHYAVHTSEYGTFLCNSEKERLVDRQLHLYTKCLWRGLEAVAHRHMNSQYTPIDGIIPVRATPDDRIHTKLFAALYIPRGLPKDTLHNPLQEAHIESSGGDPDAWPEIMRVIPSPDEAVASE